MCLCLWWSFAINNDKLRSKEQSSVMFFSCFADLQIFNDKFFMDLFFLISLNFAGFWAV